jgi:aryl-alcohol dehydrogenase-like predicted oxidoreductase
VEYVHLGQSGLEVARLGFGSGPIAELPPREAARLLSRYLDHGGNLIDTANSYGRQPGTDFSLGGVETFIGKTLGPRRQSVVIATKGYQLMDSAWKPNALGLSRTYLRRNVEASLRRLRTDYIDLYQFHDFDFHTPLEETLRTIDDLVGEGKIHYLGVSNWDGWHVVKARAVAESSGFLAPISNQVWYNLADRSIENSVLPACRDQGVSIIAWGGTGRGHLAQGQATPYSSRSTVNDYMGRALAPTRRLGATIRALSLIASQHNSSRATVALRWLLDSGACDVVLTGAYTVKELDEALATQSVRLDPTEVLRLFKASHLPTPYPAAQYELGERRPTGLVAAAEARVPGVGPVKRL